MNQDRIIDSPGSAGFHEEKKVGQAPENDALSLVTVHLQPLAVGGGGCYSRLVITHITLRPLTAYKPACVLTKLTSSLTKQLHFYFLCFLRATLQSSTGKLLRAI